MNNKLLVASNLILAIAVAVLFILHFNKKNTKTPVTPQANKVITLSDSSVFNLGIAYINTDSLLNNYDYYKKIEKDITNKRSRMEADLQAKTVTFQTKYQAYMEKANRNGFLSQATQASAEQELMTLQQELEREQQESPNELMLYQQKLLGTLNDTLLNYLERFNSDKRFEYIFGADGSLLYANQSYNITDTVLFELNKNYRSTK